MERMSREQYRRLVAMVEAIAQAKVELQVGAQCDYTWIDEEDAKKAFESLCVEAKDES